MPKKRCSERGGLMHRLSRRKLLLFERIPESDDDHLSETKDAVTAESSSGQQTNEREQSGGGWNFT